LPALNLVALLKCMPYAMVQYPLCIVPVDFPILSLMSLMRISIKDRQLVSSLKNPPLLHCLLTSDEHCTCMLNPANGTSYPCLEWNRILAGILAQKPTSVFIGESFPMIRSQPMCMLIFNEILI